MFDVIEKVVVITKLTLKIGEVKERCLWKLINIVTLQPISGGVASV